MTAVEQALVERFLSSATPGPFGYEACHHVPGRGAHASHVVIGFVIHGNEHGSLPAALELQRKLTEDPPQGPVTLLLGNLDAVERNVRFVEEDFNRVFTFDRPADSLERKRAERVRPILDAADVFLDIHQTQTPTTSAFYTFPWSTELGLWARALAAAPVGLTRKGGEVFSPGLRCLDEYVRDRGRTGLTVEIGMCGQDPDQAARALAASERLLTVADAIAVGSATLEESAIGQPPIEWYQTMHIVESDNDGSRLVDGLENWTDVEEGQLVARNPDHHSPLAGKALFPKYPPPGLPPPPDLLRLAARIGDPDNEL